MTVDEAWAACDAAQNAWQARLDEMEEGDLEDQELVRLGKIADTAAEVFFNLRDAQHRRKRRESKGDVRLRRAGAARTRGAHRRHETGEL
jgi:hypothetical protein